MPRHPDPDVEDRVLHAAEVLWRRGGSKALTMRAVAKAARTNTPAVYRRFRDRQDLIRGILLRVAGRIRSDFEKRNSLREMAEIYIDSALQDPNEYRLFYDHATLMNYPKKRGGLRPIRESRPNFGLVEQLAAMELGGAPEDHTQLALQVWALAHGTTMILLDQAVPEGHQAALREACRAGIDVMIKAAKSARDVQD